ncbi:hypothetical protein PHYBOEH_001367, partial [Phytophthora boehmeriae]
MHLSTLARSHIADENGAPISPRLLRTDNTPGEADEEKAISIKSISALDKFKAGVEKITNAYKPTPTLGKLLEWAKKKESSESVFIKLKLDEATTFADNPTFMEWVAYTRYVETDSALANKTLSEEILVKCTRRTTGCHPYTLKETTDILSVNTARGQIVDKSGIGQDSYPAL